MTLVALYYSEHPFEFAAISDILITGDACGYSETISLPFNVGGQKVAGFRQSGVRQKTEIITPELLASWSGSYVESFGHIRSARKSLELHAGSMREIIPKLKDICSSVVDCQLCFSIFDKSSASPQIHFIHSESISPFNSNDISCYALGSGTPWVTEEADFAKNPGLSVFFRQKFDTPFSRAAKTFSEFPINSNAEIAPYLRFGGWFEMILTHENGFFKAPVALNRFVSSDDGVSLAQSIRSSYHGRKLIVNSFPFYRFKEGDVKNIHETLQFIKSGWIVEPTTPLSRREKNAFWGRTSDQFWGKIFSPSLISFNEIWSSDMLTIKSSPEIENTVEMNLNVPTGHLRVSILMSTLRSLKSRG